MARTRKRNTKVYTLCSYIIAVGASTACLGLAQVGTKTHHLVDVALAGVVLYAILGLLKLVTCNEYIEEMCCYATEILPYITLPFLAAEMWLKYNVSPKEAAYCHAGLGMFMTVLALISDVVDINVKNLMLIANAASIAYVGSTNSNYTAAVAAATFLILQKVCFRCGEIHRETLFNVGLGTFSCFTLLSVK